MEIRYVNPKNLKFRENVRFRADSNLAELMMSIKSNGIQVPIKVREEDKTIVYGHRRVAAAIKLGLDKVPVILEKNIDDKKANVLNLLENIQRKDITSIEIGRQCDLLLKEKKFKMTIEELSSLLGQPASRIKVCIMNFKKLPEKFRKNVVHLTNPRLRKSDEIPENLVFAILNFGRDYRNLNDKEMNLLLNTAIKKQITLAQVDVIGRLVVGGMTLKKAIQELNNYSIIHFRNPALKTEVFSLYKKYKVKSKQDLIRQIVNETEPNLLF